MEVQADYRKELSSVAVGKVARVLVPQGREVTRCKLRGSLVVGRIVGAVIVNFYVGFAGEVWCDLLNKQILRRRVYLFGPTCLHCCV
jgi:hypothetical protein